MRLNWRRINETLIGPGEGRALGSLLWLVLTPPARHPGELRIDFHGPRRVYVYCDGLVGRLMIRFSSFPPRLITSETISPQSFLS